MKDGWKLLCDHISKMENIAVSFSGGIDSTLLSAAAAGTLPDRHIAVFADLPMLSERQRTVAADVANSLRLNFVCIRLNWDDMPGVLENTSERCYFCKKAIYSAVKDVASRNGFTVCADGENASDLPGERPGRRAAAEFGIRSPLRELNFSREQVTEMFNRLHIPADVQKETCMATRIPSGTPFTEKDMRFVEECEDIIRNISGVRQIRMRLRGGTAELVTSPDTTHLLQMHEKELSYALGKYGLTHININTAGYKN